MRLIGRRPGTVDVQARPQFVRSCREPLLPGRHGIVRMRPVPPDKEVRQGLRWVRSELERGDDSEVAAATSAMRPEEVGVAVFAAAYGLSIDGDEFDGSYCIAAHPVLASDDADAAAEGRSGDADRRARATWHRLVLSGEACVNVDQSRACTDSRGVRADGLHLLHRADVDHQTGRRRVAREAVPSTARGDRRARGAHEIEAMLHVLYRRTARDCSGFDVVKPSRIQAGRRGVTAIGRAHKSTPEQLRERVEIGNFGGGRHRAGVAEVTALEDDAAALLLHLPGATMLTCSTRSGSASRLGVSFGLCSPRSRRQRRPPPRHQRAAGTRADRWGPPSGG